MLLNYGFAVDENPFNAIEIDILELNDAFYNFFRSERPCTSEIVFLKVRLLRFIYDFQCG